MMRARPAEWLHNPFRYKRVQSDEEAIGISCRLMERLARLRDDHRVRVIVAMQDGAGESVAQEPPWYGPRVLECARGHGLSTVDAYPPLQVASRFGTLRLRPPRRTAACHARQSPAAGPWRAGDHARAAGAGLPAAGQL